MKALLLATLLLALSGCAADGRFDLQALNSNARPGVCPKPTPEQELSLNLADDMASDGRLHASLANLEGLPPDLVQVRVRKARVLRLLGRSDAEPLYRGLIGTCMAAEGEQGIGQLAAARGDNGLAMSHLQRAARLSPTDERIRNDLGVVYLNQLRMDDARFEFLTAMELKQSDTLAATNMVTLLIYQDNWKQAAELVTRANLTPDQVSDAQARADKLKHGGKVVAAIEAPAPSAK
jgi:Flp pilus assembly protein TadD